MKTSNRTNLNTDPAFYDEHPLSFSLSPAKLTRGSVALSGQDKIFVNSLKNRGESLTKKNKFLEDEQYKLQSKIKNVDDSIFYGFKVFPQKLEEKLSSSKERAQFLTLDLENSQKTIKNLIVRLE